VFVRIVFTDSMRGEYYTQCARRGRCAAPWNNAVVNRRLCSGLKIGLARYCSQRTGGEKVLEKKFEVKGVSSSIVVMLGQE
jgi:hypothetical protein